MSVIKLFLAISGIVAVSDSIDVQLDGSLEALSLGVLMDTNTTPGSGDVISAELSFLSSNTIGGGHDSRGSLCEVASQLLVGLANSHQIPSQPLCLNNNLNVKVNAGERIFIHGVANQADIAGSAEAYLFIRDKSDKVSPRRR